MLIRSPSSELSPLNTGHGMRVAAHHAPGLVGAGS